MNSDTTDESSNASDNFLWTDTDDSDELVIWPKLPNMKTVNGNTEVTKMKKKGSHEDEDGAPKHKVFKTEPPTTEKKGKREDAAENGCRDHTGDTDDDSFLELKVKQEKHNETKNSTKNSMSCESDSKALDDEKSEKKRKKNKKHKQVDSDSTSDEENYLKRRMKKERETPVPKSPLRSRSSSSEASSGSPAKKPNGINGDKRSSGQRSSSASGRSRSASSSRSRSPSPRRSTSRSASARRSPSRSQSRSRSRSQSRRRSSTSSSDSSVVSVKDTSRSNQTKSKLAEKIVFEDDEFEQRIADQAANPDRDTISKSMKHYLKHNKHLKRISTSDQKSLKFSADEDIYLVHCPTDVSVSEIRAIDLGLGLKPKMKVEGHSYEGSLNKEVKNVAISLFKKDSHVIRNVPLAGEIRFRRRAPKLKLSEAEVETGGGVVPMPVTKRRHPLFGVKYKSASRVPRAIAERLQRAAHREEEEDHTPHKKKKKKKRKSSVEETVMETTDEPDASKHSRKRRRSEATEEAGTTKRRKKSAAEPSWESEQGIEESLFNY